MALLLELINDLRARPAANKAAVVERWRERPDGIHLAKLAAAECLVADSRAAIHELQTAVDRLIRASGPERRTDELLVKAEKTGLTDEEKLELQGLLQSRGGRGDGKPSTGSDGGRIWPTGIGLSILARSFAPTHPLSSLRLSTLSEKKATHIADERQSQLKLLIASGKEQGYLTYAEVNDHLPSEIVDPEQIEDIVNMINDMGITVYEKAPDAESLLLSDAPSAPDEEAAEEAAAALATVDAEFGRTTDPVRMYMREMGTVELLTREGEIRIAKRIEEGLDSGAQSRSRCIRAPYELMLRQYEPVKTGQNRLTTSSSASSIRTRRTRSPQPQNARLELTREPEVKDDEESEEGDEEEEAIETGPDPVEAARRFAAARQALQPSAERARQQGRQGPEDARSCARSSRASSWSSSSRRRCSSS